MAAADPALFVLDHPLIQDKLARLLREIALLMGYEVFRDLPTLAASVTTPLQPTAARLLAGPPPAVVPVLRAGLGMADGLMELLPGAAMGHIGIARDASTHLPHGYLTRLPPANGRLFVLVDPMLATGNSARFALDELNRHGVADPAVRLLVLVAAPEGIAAVRAGHPDLPIYTAAVDSHLNDRAYIVPGLGDAGDRLFGTV